MIALIIYSTSLLTLLASTTVKSGAKSAKLKSPKSDSKGSTTSTVTSPVSGLRVYSEFIPSSRSKKSPAPIVVLLHSKDSNSVQIESYSGFKTVV